MNRAFFIAFVGIVGACASDTGPKPAPLVPLERGSAPKVLWSASAGDAEQYVFSPAFADGAVYAAARNGTVTRFDAANGQRVWSTDAGTRLSGGVGSDGRVVAVANEDGEVIALSATDGKKLWTARVSSEVISAPAVGAELVLVRSIDNRIAAIGAEDGKRRWVYQRSPSSLIIRTPSGITIDGDTAFAGFAGGRLAALALSNGGVRWEATVALPKGATELERVTDVVGAPAVQEREVCAATYQGRVGCYEIANGRQVWARDISSLTGVALDSRYAFVSDEKGSVQAFDRTNGRSVWKQDRLANRQLSLPQPFGEVVAVGDFEGYVHLLARETGAFVGRYATAGGPVRAAPRPIPGGLLVETQGGALYALAP